MFSVLDCCFQRNILVVLFSTINRLPSQPESSQDTSYFLLSHYKIASFASFISCIVVLNILLHFSVPITVREPYRLLMLSLILNLCCIKCYNSNLIYFEGYEKYLAMWPHRNSVKRITSYYIHVTMGVTWGKARPHNHYCPSRYGLTFYYY